jgi:hypothetical protein
MQKRAILELMMYGQRRRVLRFLYEFTYLDTDAKDFYKIRRDGVDIHKFIEHITAEVNKEKWFKKDNALFIKELDGLIDDCVMRKPQLISKGGDIIKIAPDGWEMIEWYNALWIRGISLVFQNHFVIKFLDWAIPIAVVLIGAHVFGIHLILSA